VFSNTGFKTKCSQPFFQKTQPNRPAKPDDSAEICGQEQIMACAKSRAVLRNFVEGISMIPPAIERRIGNLN
jgi:hypothetical protein